jgi:hypothetical protein
MSTAQAAPAWLTDAELVEVTHRVRPSAQARVLRGIGVGFRPRPDGTLLVSRTALDLALQQNAIVSPRKAANGLTWRNSA